MSKSLFVRHVAAEIDHPHQINVQPITGKPHKDKVNGRTLQLQLMRGSPIKID